MSVFVGIGGGAESGKTTIVRFSATAAPKSCVTGTRGLLAYIPACLIWSR